MDTPRIQKSYTDGPFGQLHCRGVYPARPTKPAVVCLHMSPKSGRIYHELLPHLADERAAIAPDYPGHGESDLPPADPHVTLEQYSECVWRVIDDRIGGDPVHLVGHHTGSMAAVEAARQRPDSVVSIVAIGAPVFSEAELASMVDLYAPIPIDLAGTRFTTMWDRILHHRGPGMTLQMCADSLAENLRAGDAYEWGHEAAFAYAPRFVENLSATTAPVLVMNPNDDTHEHTKRIDRHLNNGRRVDFPQWGHGFLNAYPADVAREMLGFFAEAERS